MVKKRFYKIDANTMVLVKDEAAAEKWKNCLKDSRKRVIGIVNEERYRIFHEDITINEDVTQEELLKEY